MFEDAALKLLKDLMKLEGEIEGVYLIKTALMVIDPCIKGHKKMMNLVI